MRTLSRLAMNSLWALMSLLMTGMFFLSCLYFYMTIHLPDVSKLQRFQLQSPMRVYAADGQLIGEFGHKRRNPVRFEDVPPLLLQAILATEDQRFFQHLGVDFIGVLRAARRLILTGKKDQGASTITMQVARNFFLTRHKTFVRKINEILLALKIETKLSKKKIFELYLNKVFLGNRAYGVAAAAYTYYGKPLSELTLPQLAMIAGLPRAPSRDNPIANPHGARRRRRHVLTRMFKSHLIDEATYREAVAAPITASYHGVRASLQAPYIAEMVRQRLFKERGEAAYTTGLQVYTTINPDLQKKANRALRRGLLRYTKRHGYRGPEANLLRLFGDDKEAWQAQLEEMNTIGELQPAAVSAIHDRSIDVLLADGSTVTVGWNGLSWARRQLEGGKYLGAAPRQASNIVKLGDVIRVTHDHAVWVMSQIPQVQGALVSLRANDGAIMALVGGFSHKQSHFNRAAQAARQPGSAFKPFIYAAALDKGYTLASMVNDAPIVLADFGGEDSLWRPQNYSLKFHGPTRLRVGLVQSRNLVSVRLLRDIGIPYALNYIERFGFNADKQPHSLSLALGAGAVTPLQLTGAYALFANGGYRVAPYLIDHIKNAQGDIIYQAQPLKVQSADADAAKTDAAAAAAPAALLAPRVLEARTAYLMTSVLQGVIQHGTARPALALKRNDIAGKTGSTNGLIDAWFAGFNGDIVTTVWVGFDKRRTTYEYAHKAALPIWVDFMGAALKAYPVHPAKQPPGIVMVRIDRNTGLLAAPNQDDAIFEVFRKEYAPEDTAAPLSPQLFGASSEDASEELPP